MFTALEYTAPNKHVSLGYWRLCISSLHPLSMCRSTLSLLPKTLLPSLSSLSKLFISFCSCQPLSGVSQPPPPLEVSSRTPRGTCPTPDAHQPSFYHINAPSRGNAFSLGNRFQHVFHPIDSCLPGRHSVGQLSPILANGENLSRITFWRKDRALSQ